MSGFSDVKDVTLMASNMPSKKCIPAMCIDPIVKKVLTDLPDVDFLNTIGAFLGNPEKNEEILLPKQCLLNLLLKRKWEEPSKKALEHALTQGHVNIVEFLLDNGETIHRVFDGSDAAGHCLYQTPLSIAIKYGHLDLVKHLVEKRGASMDSTFEDATFEDGGNMTPLMYASCLGDLHIVKYLVEEKGVNIDTSFKVNCHNYDEWDRVHYHREFSTALIHAVKNNHLHIVQYLVEKGAKINDDAFSYINPVVFAAHLNNTEIVKCLVVNGADFISWKRTREYETPANSALKHNNRDMIKIFVEKKIISKEKWYDIIYRACYYHAFMNHEIMQYLHYYEVGMNKREFDELIEETNDDYDYDPYI
jgi:ankyrin repeat protein